MPGVPYAGFMAEVALYNVSQDSQFGTPPKMAFTLLGRVAATTPRESNKDSFSPTLASFATDPCMLRATRGSPVGARHADTCFDALLGVLWTKDIASAADGADDATGTTSAGVVTWMPSIFRPKEAGAAASAAASASREAAARYAGRQI